MKEEREEERRERRKNTAWKEVLWRTRDVKRYLIGMVNMLFLPNILQQRSDMPSRGKPNIRDSYGGRIVS